MSSSRGKSESAWSRSDLRKSAKKEKDKIVNVWKKSVKGLLIFVRSKKLLLLPLLA